MSLMPNPTFRHPILILSPRALLASLVSFEALMVLYMFAGVYKADPRFAWVPVDPTGLFFVLSVLVGSFIIVLNPIHKKGLPVVFAMLCLVVWFMVSLLWSPSRLYGPDKVFLMETLALWAVIAGAVIIAPDPERLRRLFTLLLLLSLWVAVEAVLIYAETGGQLRRVALESGSYLNMGRVCGLGALVALVAWLSGGQRVVRWLCLLLFVGFGFALAIGGGRGPLVATALPLLISVVIGVRLTRRKILYSPAQLSVLVLLLIVAGGLTLYGEVTEQRLGTLERLYELTEGDFGTAATRARYYAKAGELWSEAPLLGHGTGSWPLLTGSADAPHYPHNVFAELLVEGGAVALVLFLMLLGVAIRPVTLERLRQDPQALCAMMLFANTFLNAMMSGDLPGNRAMFLMIGMLALFALRPVRATTPAQAPTFPNPSGRRYADGVAQHLR